MEFIYNNGSVAIAIDDLGFVEIQTKNVFDNGFKSVRVPLSTLSKIDFTKLSEEVA